MSDKIEKLLNLSMSSNEYEAKEALEKAIKLMNENNYTKEDIEKQQIISKHFPCSTYRLPMWMAEIYATLSFVSGCKFFWQNGAKAINKKAQGQIIGRDRDIENALYLIRIFSYQAKIQVEIFKKNSCYRGGFLTKAVKSFRAGLLSSLMMKIEEEQERFFTKKNNMSLMVISNKNKLDEIDKHLSNQKIEVKTRKDDLYKEPFGDGLKAGKDIEIHNGVNSKDNKVLGISS